MQQDHHAAILDLLAGGHFQIAIEPEQARLDLYRLGYGDERAGEQGEHGNEEAHTFLCSRGEGKLLAHGGQSTT